jgi:glycosyltransferase involved in cell wall biosynthesis
MPILHLSADYPDPLQPAKTRAVANLLGLLPEQRHIVYSLNRVPWRLGTAMLPFADAAGAEHRAVSYGAPARGLFLRRFLDRLADRIAADLGGRGIRPRLVHAHKLSVEGLAGARLAARFGCPLIVSVQGNSDVKIIAARPDLRPLWAEIWRGAAVVHPFAPWAAEALSRLLGPRSGPVLPLPCPGAAEARLAPVLTPPGRVPVIRTAFHFRDWRNKNAERLIRALARARAEGTDMALAITGGGDPEGFARLAGLAQALAPDRVSFTGPVPNAAMQALMNDGAAFALLSHRETFGMVFAEALGAGLPCLYPAGRAIGGYFEEGGVVLSAEPEDEGAIARALVRLVREEAAFKDRLARLMAGGGLDFLTRSAIAATWRAGLGAAGMAASVMHAAGGNLPHVQPDTSRAEIPVELSGNPV